MTHEPNSNGVPADTTAERVAPAQSQDIDAVQAMNADVAADPGLTSNDVMPCDQAKSGPTDAEISNQLGTTEAKRPAKHLVESLKLARAAVRVIADNRGQNILLLDLSGQTSLFDFFIIATGTSRRQLSAMATEVDRTMKSEFNERKLSITGLEESRWIILDYGSIVVHLFDEDTREFYDLESLWGDAKQVDISDLLAAALTHMTRFPS